MEVLDASVGLKWVLNEIDSDKARRILVDFQAGTRELIAPTFTITSLLTF